MKKSLLALTASAMIFSVATPSTTAQANSNYQGNQFEQGKYDTEAEFAYGNNWSNNFPYAGSDKNEIKWQFKSRNSKFESRPAIGKDGTLYVTNFGEKKFYALNKDGSIKWGKSGHEFINTPVIGEDGTIYVTTNWNLQAYNPDGSLQWKIDTHVYRSPSIDKDGTIYIHNRVNGTIEAYHKDGSLKWKSEKVASGTGEIFISQNGLIHTYLARAGSVSFYAHDKNGKQQWTIDLEKNVAGAKGFTLGPNGDIYYNHGSFIYVIGPDGKVKNEWKTEENILSAPTVSSKDGTIYLGGYDYIYAHNPDGSIKWKKKEKALFGTSVIDKNGIVYFAPERKGILALNSDGSLKWENPIDGHINTAADSNITIGKDGTIYTVGQGTDQKGIYYAITAIGDTQSETPCPQPEDYLQTIKDLIKTNNLTEEQKKEARERLTKERDELNEVLKSLE
ncbi:PQQ-binding-like beta-propeller repeat protein [Priestia taiwanensis]|uniref:Pyrrolo-quinoline quinone repeat domain-containing protein n=1 Tax=Priestia taiwanensis TaxID=1347902 RepID=A0A917ENJ2_9BACI|nr:PQQ-binding-like beta-propeller repeat protein [Priestia taiwanensis]MBM7362731.1 ribosomal protein L27 [Priestia taiwanensis]GGE64627.1 hypothetical protein GCM10007140_13550 [Priestia taiwanensis]